MTKEVTKAFILQEMQDKLKLREWVPEKFTFEESIVPVYNIEQHLEQLERITSTVSVTATGAVHFVGVPADEQWRLHRYNVIFVTGAYTIAGVMVCRPTPGFYTYLDLTAAQNTSYAHDLPKDVEMRSGDMLYINVDGYTSTGNLTLIAEVTKETIR